MNTPAPSRILYIDHTASLGGGEIALANLLGALDRTQFAPEVLLFSEGPLVGRLRAAGVTVHLLPLAPGVVQTRKDSLGLGSLLKLRTVAATLRHILKVARFIRRGGYALVHTNSLKSDIIGGLAARLARRPVIWHIRDRIADDYLPPRAARVFRHLCRRVPTYLIANSAATMATVRRGAAQSVVPSGVVLSDREGVVHDGTPEPAAGSAAAAARTGQRIGLIGRISPWKGQHIFLHAAARVRLQHPQARYLIVGSALFAEKDFEAEVQCLVDELNLRDVVEFTGFREDVGAVIAGLDIVVHASTVGEPFGQVVIEGMAAGKPVIATNGGGVPEIVEDGESGLLVPMGDAAAMSAAIANLLASPETCRRLGENGRRRVLSQFTIQHTARKVESIYREVLGRDSVPPAQELAGTENACVDRPA